MRVDGFDVASQGEPGFLNARAIDLALGARFTREQRELETVLCVFEQVFGSDAIDHGRTLALLLRVSNALSRTPEGKKAKPSHTGIFPHMDLVSQLARHKDRPGFRAYKRTLVQIERELSQGGAFDAEVSLIAKQDTRSALRRFFTLESASEPDHSLFVTTQCDMRPIRIVAPFRRGVPLPYAVEIRLRTKIDFVATFRQGFVRETWHSSPLTVENRDRALQINRLGLPNVGFRHVVGGIPIWLNEGGRICGEAGDGMWPTVWAVHSAYQGFVFNVGPRVAKYISAAPELDRLLESWTDKQAA
jgi:hypothetical protein